MLKNITRKNKMRNLIAFIIIISICFARYDCKEKWNTHTKQYECADKDDIIKYDSYNKKWVFASKDSKIKYNNMSKKWEYADKDSKLVYNRYLKKWEFK